ncbi:hypothetical protein N0V95_004445 [Ascochyta clinopodiicola]|nr:hypothetical protein N0V95_004445 [Ascochyta clinopodiicola]
MASNKHCHSPPAAEPPPKKQRPTLDDVRAADQDMEHRFKKMVSDMNVETKRNMKKSPFLRLPAELRNRIYGLIFTGQTYRFNGQTQNLSAENRQAYRVYAASNKPLAPLRVCRQMYYEAKNLPYTTSTFAFATFDFVSLFDLWNFAVGWNPNPFLDCLESLPAPYIEKVEVVGVAAGHDGSEQMWKRKVVGYNRTVDCKTKLAEYIHLVYPKAEVTFRTVDDYASFLSYV